MVAIYIWVNDTMRKLQLEFSGYGPREAWLNLGVSELIKLVSSNSGHSSTRSIPKMTTIPEMATPSFRAGRHIPLFSFRSLRSLSFFSSRGCHGNWSV